MAGKTSTSQPPRAVVIAAPASGHGKTTATLGLLRAFSGRGETVSSFKVGPDYIDPGFHAAASGRPCVNLDGWAMRPGTLVAALGFAGEGADLLVGEGVMGLFDGAPGGEGSTADVAARLDLPVLLVVDASAQAASAAALVHGFATWRDDVRLAGVLFNRVGSDSHAAMLREATAATGVPVLGCLPRQADLALPERHLGLVLSQEHADLDAFLDAAGRMIAAHADLDGIAALARPPRAADAETGGGSPAPAPAMEPLGQHIAVARDRCFAFLYPHLLEGWRRAGADLSFFSPLADEAPPDDADAVYLPGGYPELNGRALAAAGRFRAGMTQAAERGAAIYGECGGYMTLGAGLIDREGARHAMLGLLPVETSFAEPGLHLGYRQIACSADSPLGPAGARFRGHEFHYARQINGDSATPLFRASDARAERETDAGCVRGRVFGSFLHLIDRA